MDYLEALQSGSSPKIRRAAKNIAKHELPGYGPQLLAALKALIDKPRLWHTQCEVIRALGVTHCTEALPYLKELIERDYEATVLYRELAFSTFLLENIETQDLSFVYESIEKGNILQISGACRGMFFKRIVPLSCDIRKISSGISPFTEDEKYIAGPRIYIAALAYYWPMEEARDFLENCLLSESPSLARIARDVLHGKKPRFEISNSFS